MKILKIQLNSSNFLKLIVDVDFMSHDQIITMIISAIINSLIIGEQYCIIR